MDSNWTALPGPPPALLIAADAPSAKMHQQHHHLRAVADSPTTTTSTTETDSSSTILRLVCHNPATLFLAPHYSSAKCPFSDRCSFCFLFQSALYTMFRHKPGLRTFIRETDGRIQGKSTALSSQRIFPSILHTCSHALGSHTMKSWASSLSYVISATLKPILPFLFRFFADFHIKAFRERKNGDDTLDDQLDEAKLARLRPRHPSAAGAFRPVSPGR